LPSDFETFQMWLKMKEDKKAIKQTRYLGTIERFPKAKKGEAVMPGPGMYDVVAVEWEA